MEIDGARFLQELLDDYEVYVDQTRRRFPRKSTTLDQITAEALEVKQLHRSLMKRLPMAQRLVQWAGYDANGLNFSATMEPLLSATKNLLLVGIGAFEHGTVSPYTTTVGGRPKDQKFGILDAPRLLMSDLKEALGVLGAAVLYLDIDHFKDVNTKFTERVVDRDVLPQFQRLIADVVQVHGTAYAEGGDEVSILLPNSSLTTGMAVANELFRLIRSTTFAIETQVVRLTISAGLATTASEKELGALPDRANEAKRHAKETGRDRLSVSTLSGCQPA